jgi:hypothetical protein
MNFKHYIREFRSPVPLGSEFSQYQLKIMLDNEDIDILPNAIRIEGKDIVINCISLSAKDKCFILTDRENREEIIGYLFTNNTYKDYWQTRDIAIFPKYKNLGIGTEFYIKLVKSGIKLMNGYSLSAPMVKVWTEKLPKNISVKVVNTETDAVEEFNDKPVLDKADDTDQKWFYIAESEICIETLRTDFFENMLFEQWLYGNTSPLCRGFHPAKYEFDGF